MIADVDAYTAFLPFATSSKVLSASIRSPNVEIPLEKKGWLKDGTAGDVWDLEAELNIGAMGYTEGYVSKVEMKKWSEVTVSLFCAVL